MIRKKLGEITGTVKEVMASGPPRPLTAPGAHLFLTSGGGAGEQCWGQPGGEQAGEAARSGGFRNQSAGCLWEGGRAQTKPLACESPLRLEASGLQARTGG